MIKAIAILIFLVNVSHADYILMEFKIDDTWLCKWLWKGYGLDIWYECETVPLLLLGVKVEKQGRVEYGDVCYTSEEASNSLLTKSTLGVLCFPENMGKQGIRLQKTASGLSLYRERD